MNAERVASYVGMPYSETDPFGPDSFNCWGLMRWIQLYEFGRELPTITIGDIDATVKAHSDSLETGVYRLVDSPMHGDCVLLRGGNNPHVGVWLEIDGGGVIHSQTSIGVIWTPLHRLNQLGYSRRVYYRVRANESCKLHPTCKPIPPDD